MMWQQLKIKTDSDLAEKISEALLEMGALSASIEDAEAGTEGERPIFGEPGEPDTGLWESSIVAALLPPDADAAGLVSQLCLAVDIPTAPPFWVETVEEQDWVRLTQSQFDPIQISSRLWIVPTWHEAPDPAALNIALDPGLAFGTGSHPTTRLCLQWLDAHGGGGDTVLDYGCGSGILAIAAAKLGAKRVFGIDLDPQAVASAKCNAESNQVAISFYLPEDAPKGMVDTLIANILTNPLRMLAPALSERVRPGGTIVLSGILTTQADELCDIYREWFDVAVDGEEEGWVRIVGTRRGAGAP